MSDDDIWPPKPTLPDPLTEYDELIEASLPTLPDKTINYDLVLPLSGVPLSVSSWVFHWALRTKNPLSPRTEGLERRLQLTQVLLEERGLDLMQADAVVQSYYQRHDMAATPAATRRALVLPLVTVALALVAMFLGLLAFYLSFHRDTILSQPNHRAAIIALDNAKLLLQIVSLTLLALVYGFSLMRYLVMRRRSKKPRVETRG